MRTPKSTLCSNSFPYLFSWTNTTAILDRNAIEPSVPHIDHLPLASIGSFVHIYIGPVFNFIFVYLCLCDDRSKQAQQHQLCLVYVSQNAVKMWLVKRGGERNGARLVRYSLLTLIIFMLVCTSLAIILVSFASDYSAALHDRTQGIILILVLITLNYSIGLVALWRCHLIVLSIFALADLFLCVVCLFSTHQGHHIGNLGALVVFGASGLLSGTFVWQTCSERAVRSNSSVQNASVNCYHHVPDDWYDYGSTSAYITEKDELIPNQLLLPYNCHCDINVDEMVVTPNDSSTFCTVETNEGHFLRGDRHAV